MKDPDPAASPKFLRIPLELHIPLIIEGLIGFRV